MFWVTGCLAVGPYPLGPALDELVNAGVTHVLNVGDGPGRYPATRFEEALWIPVVDLRPLPLATAERCLSELHRVLHREGARTARVYVHCAAGQNRSPTILWLYLIAAGCSAADAGERIAAASLDACPGHPALVTDEHVRWAQAWGRTAHPAPRADLLAPA